MKISLRSTIALNRKAFLLLGILLSLAAFGTSGRVNAQGNSKTISRGESNATDIAGRPSLNPTKGVVSKPGPAPAAPASPAAVTTFIWAYDFNSQHIAYFDASAPGVIIRDVALTGLAAQELLVGMDFRPADGKLYAAAIKGPNAPGGASSRVVSISTLNGAVTTVGTFTPVLSDTDFYGFDFDPKADQIRVVNSSNLNIRLSPVNGSIVSTDTPLNITPAPPLPMKVTQLAYSNNTAGAATTTLFGIDFNNDTLVQIGGVGGAPSPNLGVVTTIGPLGVNTFQALGGFDIQATTGTAYAILFVAGKSTLYTIDLATGAATISGAGIVGNIGGAIPQIDGMTVAPILSAAGVTISGSVVTADGRGLRNANVFITDSHGTTRSVATGATGYYQFDNVQSGDTYVVGVTSKSYRFLSRVLQVTDTLSGVDFTADQ